MTSHTPGTRVSDYDYTLPEERIARYPTDVRDGSRLLMVDRSRADHCFGHGHFRELPTLFTEGDLLVLNETGVFPARLRGHKPSGAAAEILLLRPHVLDGEEETASDWEALVRPGGKLKPGRSVEIGPDLVVEIVDSTPDGGRIVRLHSSMSTRDALARYGQVPLPPYLERDAEPLDRERYQTVYARERGSVAAPTAGLHFTPELLAELEGMGVGVARLVLHVGVGTFRPVAVEDPSDHDMHEERFMVPKRTLDAVDSTRARGGRVWAVGTTVVRALEAAAREPSATGAQCTALFIRPPFEFRAVDALITNFHLPRSTLLMLVAAFTGYQRTMAAYREAVTAGYRFYSYGDAMVIR